MLLVLCELNKLSVEYTDEELVDLGTGIAEGRYKKEDVLAWLEFHCFKNKSKNEI